SAVVGVRRAAEVLARSAVDLIRKIGSTHCCHMRRAGIAGYRRSRPVDLTIDEIWIGTRISRAGEHRYAFGIRLGGQQVERRLADAVDLVLAVPVARIRDADDIGSALPIDQVGDGNETTAKGIGGGRVERACVVRTVSSFDMGPGC